MQSDKLLAAVNRPDFRERLIDELAYREASAGRLAEAPPSVLGHISLKMAMRYVHAVDAAKREAMANPSLKSVLGKQSLEGEKTRSHLI